MDDEPTHRVDGGVPGDTEHDVLPTWRSRARAAGWLAAVTVGLGVATATAIAVLAVLVWVMVSAAVT